MHPLDHIKKMTTLLEARIPEVEYEETAKGVVAKLRSYKSQSYTKLAQKVQRLSSLEEEVKRLKEEIKDEARSEVADIFNAEDVIHTRIVETMSFILTLSKDPKPTESPKYKEILETLSEHLTPELIAVLEQLKREMVTVTQKSPSLKVKTRESVMESVRTQALVQHVDRWAENYDNKLEQLRSTVEHTGG